MITELYHIDLINLDLELTSFKTRWNFQYIFKQFFLWKKERFYSAGYRAQDLSIAGRMLYVYRNCFLPIDIDLSLSR